MMWNVGRAMGAQTTPTSAAFVMTATWGLNIRRAIERGQRRRTRSTPFQDVDVFLRHWFWETGRPGGVEDQDYVVDSGLLGRRGERRYRGVVTPFQSRKYRINIRNVVHSEGVARAGEQDFSCCVKEGME